MCYHTFQCTNGAIVKMKEICVTVRGTDDEVPFGMPLPDPWTPKELAGFNAKARQTLHSQLDQACELTQEDKEDLLLFCIM